MKLITSTPVILLSLLLTVSARQQRPFDYFMFTREWPGTFCSNTECKYHPKNTTVFTIHGLWPNYNNGRWPQFCDPQNKFDPAQVEDLMQQMNKEWPSYILGPFWQHEWEKHGTCCEDVFRSQHDYFKAALDLHEKYELEGALAGDGIVPSSTKRYSLRDIHAAFKSTLGATPQLCCEHGELNEVRMCVSKALVPFNCPVTSIGCPSYVLLPPFPEKKGDAIKEVLKGDQPQLQSDTHTPGNHPHTQPLTANRPLLAGAENSGSGSAAESGFGPGGLMQGTIGGSAHPFATGVGAGILMLALLVILVGTVSAAAFVRPSVSVEPDGAVAGMQYVALVGEVEASAGETA